MVASIPCTTTLFPFPPFARTEQNRTEQNRQMSKGKAERLLQTRRDYLEGCKTRRIDYFETENGYYTVRCAELQDEIKAIHETERLKDERAEKKFNLFRDKNTAYIIAEKERQKKTRKRKRKATATTTTTTSQTRYSKSIKPIRTSQLEKNPWKSQRGQVLCCLVVLCCDILSCLVLFCVFCSLVLFCVVVRVVLYYVPALFCLVLSCLVLCCFVSFVLLCCFVLFVSSCIMFLRCFVLCYLCLVLSLFSVVLSCCVVMLCYLVLSCLVSSWIALSVVVVCCVAQGETRRTKGNAQHVISDIHLHLYNSPPSSPFR